MKLIKYLFLFSTLLPAAVFTGCNKDDVIDVVTVGKPAIELNSETGIYTVKVGHELTISPVFVNCEDAEITWTLDGEIVCRATSWTSTWTEPGEWFVTIEAENEAGRAVEEIKVECMELTPPVVSLTLPEGGLKVLVATDYIFRPDIQHADMEDFRIAWYVNGSLEGDEQTFVFNESEPGTYRVKIVAANCDGESTTEFDVEVVETLPYSVQFLPPSYLQTSTDRYTFAGRPVYLHPVVKGIDNPVYAWSVDGNDAAGSDQIFGFTPDAPGEYEVTVTVSGGETESRAITRNISTVDLSVSASVKVVCVSATEEERMRPKTGSSSKYCDRVFEYIPAPGQFIGEESMGNALTPEAAATWAKGRLDARNYVSLGSFGGYIIVGFDHSIAAGGGEYDLAIEGNAFLNAQGGSNEPGIVWVMQDVNGNGLPDDEWYELKGSEFDNPKTIRDFAVTYYRPSGPGMDVDWTDSEGNSGKVDYLGTFHKQPYYYPAWVEAPAYTLYGTCLPSHNSLDESMGFWTNAPYDWGYADNIGTDSYNDNGQFDGFRFSNAVYLNGSGVELQYVDFVKVQVGVLAKSGMLGEVSTEVFSFLDYSM